VRVGEGQAVQAGQVLAVLETADDRERLRSSRETLAALQARIVAQKTDTQSNLTRLQNQLAEAQRNLALSQGLLAVGSASQNEIVQLSRQVSDLQAQIASLKQTGQSAVRDLEAQITARQSEISSLERTIVQSQLKAPVTGVVSTVGYLVGVDTGTSFVRLVEAGSTEVRVRLSESDVAKVKPGQPALIELDSLPGSEFPAKVTRLGVQAEIAAQGGSSILPVFLKFTTPAGAAAVRPGLTATARITTLRMADALKVPLEALVEQSGKTSVWVVDEAKKTAQKQAIMVRARNLTQAAVEGIQAKALLVSLPPETLKDGQKVSFVLGPKEK
jgi:multidrug efflux pump subunit AcrA (membrane-fusion protein)